MSTVTPSDGGYRYYQRAIQENEEELRRQSDRAKEGEEKRVADLEQAYAADLKKREEATARTVDEMRDEYDKALDRERENSRADAMRVRNQTYDRLGRYNGQEADTLKDSYAALQQAHDESRTANARHLSSAESDYQAKVDDQEARHQRELEDVARVSRDSALAAYSELSEKGDEAYEESVRRSKSEYDEMVHDGVRDKEFERRRLTRATQEVKEDADRRLAISKTEENRALAAQAASSDERVKEALVAQRVSNEAVAQGYSEQVKQALDLQRELRQEVGKGREEALKEHEDGWRSTLDRVEQAYGDVITKEKADREALASHYARANDQSLQGRNRYFTELISKKESERANERKQLDEIHAEDRKGLDQRMRRDREEARLSAERQLNQASIDRDKALENQAKAYQETAESLRQSHEAQEKLLEENLRRATTSEDASLISPSAEAAIRKGMGREYDKVLAEERERNRRSELTTREAVLGDLEDERAENRANLNSLQAVNTIDRNEERSSMTEHLNDTEFKAQALIRAQSLDHERETETMNRAFARSLEEQRNQYRTMIQELENDRAAKLLAQRQAAEFEYRIAQRQWATKNNEAVRDFETKLSQQREEYEIVLQGLKGENEKIRREADKRIRDETTKAETSFDQRVQQLEVAHRERERFLTHSYDQEMDKIRRNNQRMVERMA